MSDHCGALCIKGLRLYLTICLALLGLWPKFFFIFNSGRVTRTVCFSIQESCKCVGTTNIDIVNCGGFFIYKTPILHPRCFSRLCLENQTESMFSISRTKCCIKLAMGHLWLKSLNIYKIHCTTLIVRFNDLLEFSLLKYFRLSDFRIAEHAVQFRSSRPKVFCKKDVLRNTAKFTGKHLCQSLLFNKVAGWGTGVFLWILWNF